MMIIIRRESANESTKENFEMIIYDDSKQMCVRCQGDATEVVNGARQAFNIAPSAPMKLAITGGEEVDESKLQCALPTKNNTAMMVMPADLERDVYNKLVKAIQEEEDAERRKDLLEVLKMEYDRLKSEADDRRKKQADQKTMTYGGAAVAVGGAALAATLPLVGAVMIVGGAGVAAVNVFEKYKNNTKK